MRNEKLKKVGIAGVLALSMVATTVCFTGCADDDDNDGGVRFVELTTPENDEDDNVNDDDEKDSDGKDDDTSFDSSSSYGTLGKISYRLDRNGLLTIKGTGEIKTKMWSAEKVVVVIIEEGITSIADGVFDEHVNLEKAYFPNSLEKVGANNFTKCSKLDDISCGSDTIKKEIEAQIAQSK